MKNNISRTKNYIKQLKWSFLFKFATVTCSFFIVPLMISYLGSEQYGVWSTLLSILSWVVLFDVGIGNGLRNKLSEAIAKDNINEAKGYISTAYIIIGFITFIMIIALNIISFFLPYQAIFNTVILTNNEIKLIIRITGTLSILNFWLSLINQLFNGLQKTSYIVIGQFFSHLLSLIFVLLLTYFTSKSLVYLSFFYGISFIIINLILSIFFFNRWRELLPRFIWYKKKYIRSIITLGLKFFIIQIAVIILFTTNKIVITQLFGPQHVTEYDVVFKLYSIITVVHSMLMAPLWSAYGDAFHKNDFYWIKATLNNQLKIFILILLLVIIFFFYSKSIIHFWISKDLLIDNKLIFAMSIFIVITTWNNIFAYFINSTNKLNIQMYTSIVGIIINLPLAYYMVKKLNFGIEGVIYSSIISLSFFAILGPLQSKKILNTKFLKADNNDKQ